MTSQENIGMEERHEKRNGNEMSCIPLISEYKERGNVNSVISLYFAL